MGIALDTVVDTVADTVVDTVAADIVVVSDTLEFFFRRKLVQTFADKTIQVCTTMER